MKLGRFDDAEEHLAVALAADPLSPSVNKMAGRLHLYRAKYDVALQYFWRTEELNPN